MTASVRFLKAEREYLVKLLEMVHAPTKADIKARDGILEKLEKSELIKKTAKPAGIGWERAAAAMRGVLGPTLALPPSPDIGWRSKMSGRVRDLGLSELDCVSIAKVLRAKGWKTYSFEKTIWAADRLLAEAQLPLSGVPDKPKPTTRPVEMDEW